jgi:hypothetical protein
MMTRRRRRSRSVVLSKAPVTHYIVVQASRLHRDRPLPSRQISLIGRGSRRVRQDHRCHSDVLRCVHLLPPFAATVAVLSEVGGTGDDCGTRFGFFGPVWPSLPNSRRVRSTRRQSPSSPRSVDRVAPMIFPHFVYHHRRRIRKSSLLPWQPEDLLADGSSCGVATPTIFGAWWLMWVTGRRKSSLPPGQCGYLAKFAC